jgi:hypothetical protein
LVGQRLNFWWVLQHAWICQRIVVVDSEIINVNCVAADSEIDNENCIAADSEISNENYVAANSEIPAQ